MIPGTDVMMEDLLTTFSKEIGLKYFDEITDSCKVTEKMTALGISSDTLLSRIYDKYNLLPELTQEFEIRYNSAIDKEALITRNVMDVRQAYETVLPGNDYVSLLLNTDGVTKWHWPADYVAYHCKVEGFNPPLRNFAICLVSELGFDENTVVKNLEQALKGLAKGYSMALFHQYLLKKQSELLGYDFKYQTSTLVDGSPVAKLAWLGSPAQFVKVIKLLGDRGYIKIDANKSEDIAFVIQHFIINSQRGPVAFNTLRGYFSDRNTKFTSSEADLPDAENPLKTSSKKR